MTVVETEEFLRVAKPLFSDEERGRLVDFLAMNPEAGLIMAETGGVRKLRWAMEGDEGNGAALASFITTTTSSVRSSSCLPFRKTRRPTSIRRNVVP